MKIFGNPWFTGVLVAAAAGVVIYQVLGATGRRPKSTAAGPVTAGAVIPAPAAATTAPANAPDEASTMDRKSVELHLEAWMEKPQRDVFTSPVAAHRVATTNAAPSRWHLKAIWAQTGGRVAAINNGVYSEGDHLEDLTVERIEDHQVWLTGPAGREVIEFASARTNATDRLSSSHAYPATSKGGNASPQ